MQNSRQADSTKPNFQVDTPFKADLSLGQYVRGEHGIERCPIVSSAADVASVFSRISTFERETMIAGTLDCNARLIHWRLLAVGTSDRLAMRIGDAFFGVIQHSGSGVILIHNHPSGSLTASDADITLTRNVAEAGLLLGYPLLDHIILSRTGYCSIMTPPVLQRGKKKTVVQNALVKEAAEKGLSAIRWRCSSCGNNNGVFSIATSSLGQSKGLCTAARCMRCKKFTWLKNI